MKTFNLVKDSKYTTWWRDFYEVEAETIEEAIKMIAEDKVDADSMEELDDTLETMTIMENQGNPTEEIYKTEDILKNGNCSAKPIWDNINQFKQDES